MNKAEKVARKLAGKPLPMDSSGNFLEVGDHVVFKQKVYKLCEMREHVATLHYKGGYEYYGKAIFSLGTGKPVNGKKSCRLYWVHKFTPKVHQQYVDWATKNLETAKIWLEGIKNFKP